MNGNVDTVTNTELEKLLQWKGIVVSKMGKRAERKVLYKQTVEEGKGINVDWLGPCVTWTDADEEELEALNRLTAIGFWQERKLSFYSLRRNQYKIFAVGILRWS